MERHDFIARTAKALEGLDPESIDTFYIDLDGYEVEFWKPVEPGDFADLPRDNRGRVCTMRARENDWMSTDRPATDDAATRWLRNYHGSIDSTALLLAFRAGQKAATHAPLSPVAPDSGKWTAGTERPADRNMGPESGTPDLVQAFRESIERARERRRTEPRPEFKALIDAFQPEYDALLADRAEGES